MNLSSSKGAGAAIPTEYKGINFRSRLEATWAAFFDLCKWEWEYEPFDLKGYIPDFLLRGARPFLVDVRPLTTEGEYLHRAKELEPIVGGKDLLVVGAGVFEINEGWDMSIGYMSDKNDPDWYANAVLMTCVKCGHHSFRHQDGMWDSVICGCYDGDHYLGEFKEALDFWAQAKNATQWRPVTPRYR